MLGALPDTIKIPVDGYKMRKVEWAHFRFFYLFALLNRWTESMIENCGLG